MQALRPLSEGRAVAALASGALLLLQATPLQQAGGGVSWHVAEELPASPPPSTSLCGLDPLLRGPTHCFAAASNTRLHVWSAEPPPTEGGLRLLTAELAACVESHALDRPPLALLSAATEILAVCADGAVARFARTYAHADAACAAPADAWVLGAAQEPAASVASAGPHDASASRGWGAPLVGPAGAPGGVTGGARRTAARPCCSAAVPASRSER